MIVLGRKYGSGFPLPSVGMQFFRHAQVLAVVLNFDCCLRIGFFLNTINRDGCIELLKTEDPGSAHTALLFRSPEAPQGIFTLHGDHRQFRAAPSLYFRSSRAALLSCPRESNPVPLALKANALPTELTDNFSSILSSIQYHIKYSTSKLKLLRMLLRLVAWRFPISVCGY